MSLPPEAAGQAYEKAQIVRGREQAIFARLCEPGMTPEAFLAWRAEQQKR